MNTGKISPLTSLQIVRGVNHELHTSTDEAYSLSYYTQMGKLVPLYIDIILNM